MFTIYYLDKKTVLYSASYIQYRQVTTFAERYFMLQQEYNEHTTSVVRARSLLNGLEALYGLWNETHNKHLKNKILSKDHVYFFFKAYEVSLRKARALGIVDLAYLERHIEILRSTPSLNDNIVFLMRLTSELKLIVEEYIEEIQEFKELTGRLQPTMANALSDDDSGSKLHTNQKRKMRRGW
jgi:hypothetical protein